MKDMPTHEAGPNFLRVELFVIWEQLRVRHVEYSISNEYTRHGRLTK